MERILITRLDVDANWCNGSNKIYARHNLSHYEYTACVYLELVSAAITDKQRANKLFNSILRLCFVFRLLTPHWQQRNKRNACAKNLPQNGTPSGIHCPDLSQTLRFGPKSSNPRSQLYVATVPTVNVSFEKKTDECAGAPGNRHTSDVPVIVIIQPIS